MLGERDKKGKELSLFEHSFHFHSIPGTVLEIKMCFNLLLLMSPPRLHEFR